MGKLKKYLNEGTPIKGKIKSLKIVMKSVFDDLSKEVEYEEGVKLVKKASKLAEVEILQDKYLKSIMDFMKG